MILSLSEKQCNILRYVIQESYSNFAERLNAMDEGNEVFNADLYDDYYNKYKELREIDDYIWRVLNE